MEEKKLSLSSYLLIGSMLFGLFFGAGNLIFPVHVGQEAGLNLTPATIGFLITGIGLPFLGVVAIGISRSDGLYDLASRVHPIYGLIFTMLLYLTIGPFFALPRTGTVSFEIGIAPFIKPEHQTLALGIFTILFFAVALAFSLKPSKILVWVGKILNPLFLLFLAFLIIAAFINPMGSLSTPTASYQSAPFITGFTQGYQTMDALASLAFGIIVVQAIKDLGVTKPKRIAVDTIKSGVITIILMGIIYSCLAFIGATSVGKFPISANGGIALAQIADHYFGSFGSILLAIIVTLACLKTAIGIITAGGECFNQLFPKISYRNFAIGFSIFSAFVANLGLTKIIQFSVPVLTFLYPLAISLIILAFLSPLFHHRRVVYAVTTAFTFCVSIIDGIILLPINWKAMPVLPQIVKFYQKFLPFYDIGMGWIVPVCLGLVVGWIISLATQKKTHEISF